MDPNVNPPTAESTADPKVDRQTSAVAVDPKEACPTANPSTPSRDDTSNLQENGRQGAALAGRVRLPSLHPVPSGATNSPCDARETGSPMVAADSSISNQSPQTPAPPHIETEPVEKGDGEDKKEDGKEVESEEKMQGRSTLVGRATLQLRNDARALQNRFRKRSFFRSISSVVIDSDNLDGHHLNDIFHHVKTKVMPDLWMIAFMMGLAGSLMGLAVKLVG